MHPDAYGDMATNEDTHWWFAGRRAILATILQELHLPADAQILEIGAGTGGNLPMLAKFGNVRAMESSKLARQLALKKTNGHYDIRHGALPDILPFAPKSFDLICLFDVLEHVEDDAAALSACHRLLKAGGRLLLTVPAHLWMWSAHDTRLHHHRRYTRYSLTAAVSPAMYQLQRLSYFNTVLFPLAALARLTDRLTGKAASTGSALPSPWINTLLLKLFASERHWLRRRNLPYGVSLLMLLETCDKNVPPAPLP